MTLPLCDFRVVRAGTVEAAVTAQRSHEGSRFLAGGTDLIVNLRRGLGNPAVLIDLNGIEELDTLTCTEAGAYIGGGVTLVELGACAAIRERHAAIAEAVTAIAGPSHRNLATVGGNLCLDTRCIYYNQSEWWRHANGYCLKYGGDICHVAPQGQRCHAAFSGDLAPALLVLDAEVQIAGSSGRRRIPLAGLYADDGRAHLALAAGELVVAVHVPPNALHSGYAKVRVRGAMDFPLAGVAVALAVERDKLSALHVGLTGTNPRPFLLDGTDSLLGRRPDEATLQQLVKMVQKQVQPVRTTLASGNYRRLAAAALVRRLTEQLATQAAGQP
ncbi:MAG TPA: 4-hydroxybenzoyl-CoA reductase subunit beta [Steroidobacteraceae bacterium]